MDVQHCVDFMLLVGDLKKLKRKGWVMSGIPHPESVSDHMYRMAMISMLLSHQLNSVSSPQESIRQPKIRMDHMMKLSLVHDLAESIVGDITPRCGISDREKHELEMEAMRKIANEVCQGSSMGCELLALWSEYEENVSVEAQLVHQIDKLEMIVQACEYERELDIELNSFFTSTQNSFYHPVLMAWADAMRQMRPKSMPSS